MTRIGWATSIIIALSGVAASCNSHGTRDVNGTTSGTTSNSTTSGTTSNSTTSGTASNTTTSTPASGPATVNSTILILTNDDGSSITPGLQGYGIPYQVVTVPQNNAQLPVLNDTANHGNYGGIIVSSEVAYDYNGTWSSALNSTQWGQIYSYQENFGVRMVRIDVFPGVDFGTTTAISGAGCCDAGVEQLVRISDASDFPTANINTNQGVSTEGLWHYPATITNTTLAKPVWTFDPSGSFTNETVAAVINDFGNRKQMVVFMSWALQWSTTCAFLQHSYIHWMTRGLFVGKRKIYLNTQIDDMHLETDIYYPNGTTFRVRPADLDIHKSWMTDLNSRLPTGSAFKLEVCQNGNGAIDNATDQDSSSGVCFPDYPVDYNSPPDMPPEWVKPLGTGTNLWPHEWTTYNWSAACNQIDDVYSWWYVKDNQDAFFHITHTFTHLELDNATYHDAALEIQFNIAWLKQLGVYSAPNFSPLGLVPPAITGLHNGDVIKAWMDNGLKWAIGDNTRPALRSNVSEFYPIRTTVAANGYDGLYIIPRWATTIYYNCDTADCTLTEWIKTSAGQGTFADLLVNAKAVNTFHLLGLHPDPYMFHQANMRAVDMPQYAVGNKNVQSLLQIWVETIAQEMTRLTNWPIVSLKNDDIAQLFIDRMTLDECTPNMSYQLSDDRQTITGVEVTANGNTCSVPVPVTFPGTATTSGTATSDKLGSEPLIMWTTLSGSTVDYSLGAAVPV